MDENQTGTAQDHDPFRELLRFDGPWAPAGGQRLTHLQTGESFGRLALADAHDASDWAELVDALADLDSERLVLPRAVIDNGTAVLYSGPDDLGESFASLLEASGMVEQDETVRMAADLALALRQLHSSGAVLGRLRLQDVLRSGDGGWALLVSPSSGAHTAAGAELARLSRADVVLLASAAVTVLTGRRPSAARTRAPLRSTHPLLDPEAADALDLVLDRAAQQEGEGSAGTGERAGPTARAGTGMATGSGMLTASELELLLRPAASCSAGFEPTEAEATGDEPARSGPTGAGPADVTRRGRPAVGGPIAAKGAGDFGPLSADEAEPLPEGQERDDPTVRLLRAEAREPERWRRSARSLRGSTRRGDGGAQHTGGGGEQGRGGGPQLVSSDRADRGRARPARGRARPSAAASEQSRRPRRVLAGAAAVVIGAAALAGWQVVTGPPDEIPSAVGSAEQVPGAAVGDQPAAGGDDPTQAAPGESVSSETGAATEPEAVSAQHSPEYAAAALIALRADALRTGDHDLLESVYLPEAADLADDLETLDQARSSGAFEDLQMALADAQPSASDPSAARAEASPPERTATVTGTVGATGSGLDPEAAGEATLRQDVSIEMVAGDDGAWRLLDVTPM